MTVNKITSAPTPNKQIEKINEIIDNLGGGGATALSDLTDVTLTSTASGDVLAYDGSGWVNNSKYLKNTALASNSLDIFSSSNGATLYNEISIGSAGNKSNSVSIGMMSKIDSAYSYAYCVALGYEAKIGSSGQYSIQLGQGTNNTAYTLAVGFGTGMEYTLLNGTTGLIPDARLSSNIARMPDYDNKVLVASGRVATETSYTCPSDGYLLCVCINGYSGTPATIKINDFLVVNCTSAATSYSSTTSAIFPVFSGDEVKYLMNYPYLVTNRAIYFVPMKGV